MKILVAGGAGFIGSHIVEVFSHAGHDVTVIDGLMPDTGGDRKHLAHLPNVEFIGSRLEAVPDLAKILNRVDLVIDCIGWTRHLLALENPAYDLELNVSSHLYLIEQLRNSKCRSVIWLGSRGQYGRLSCDRATEDHPQIPEDVQAVHKTAAESHWRIAAKLHGLNVASVLFGNTFGPRQPMIGRDVGMVASFTRSLLAGEEVEIYGKDRMRDFVYVSDLAEALLKLAGKGWSGFEAYHLVGQHVTLESLVKVIQDASGSGSYSFQDFPDEVRQIDMGNFTLSDQKFRRDVGDYSVSSLSISVSATIQSIREDNE